jgi:protease-4
VFTHDMIQVMASILSYLRAIVRFCIKIMLGSFVAAVTIGLTGTFCLVVLGIILTIVGSQSKGSGITRDVLYGRQNSRHQFISIPVDGMIVGDGSDVGAPLGIFNESLTYGYEIKRTLRELADDPSVEGVILEINSPGGTIYGAKAIADGVLQYKERTKKPVIAFVSGLAASGGYWSAISADEVIADAGTSVGSIGVISGPFQYYDTVIAQDGGILSGGIVTQKGIETTYVTAGRSKDFGNPYRKMTKEEIDSLQAMVNNEYETFVSYVSSRRNISPEVITNDLGAVLYDGKTALEKKMIDRIGSREEAYEELASRAQVSDDFSVSQEHPKKGILMTLLQSQTQFTAPKASLSLCGLTNVRLVYHGDVAALCDK